MQEQLQLIESQLYKSELTFPPLRDLLLRSGELRAWYKYYRGYNQWVGKHYTEENVFLMSHVLIWNQISENGRMTIYSFDLNEIAKIERAYAFEDKTLQKLVLSEATITFKGMKDGRTRDFVVLKRPLPAEMGNAEGFDKLLDLLY
ncbi:MAG: hypothetical protein CVU90_03540 [Firmicutes bacterium HGW-Firmicutes-15]|nr:MAG: hypothetical protein CVU90_03540 [Firmicutes bacterium HGW-Firmicutes-15]